MKGPIFLAACLLVSDLAAQTVFYNHIAEEDGSGLGPFTGKETISKIGGGIKVHSGFGVQTSFEVHIPL